MEMVEKWRFTISDMLVTITVCFAVLFLVAIIGITGWIDDKKNRKAYESKDKNPELGSETQPESKEIDAEHDGHPSSTWRSGFGSSSDWGNKTGYIDPRTGEAKVLPNQPQNNRTKWCGRRIKGSVSLNTRKKWDSPTEQ